MSVREVWIKCMDRSDVEIVGISFARSRLLELLRSGYAVSSSVLDEDGLTLYVTLQNESFT